VPDVDDVLGRWIQESAQLPRASVRVVLADIDGVLTPGEGGEADAVLLQRVAAWNDSAQRDPMRPGVALCSGRQAPYVELFAQVTHAFLPCIFEHGAGLIHPRRFDFQFNPALGHSPWRVVAQAREVLDAPLLMPGLAFVQPGKEATLTLYPLGDATVAEVAELAAAALARAGVALRVTPNIRGVEVRPPGIDKGAGAEWLAREIGVGIDQFAGVGDADDDLSFLDRVAFPATPANGSPVVRSRARYVARQPFALGFLEILEHLAELNRRAGS
jgi:3-deoxy-D-manno-octulosonate 8-phosphate phosphatase KdsC-like HAD superfamily phosphatase